MNSTIATRTAKSVKSKKLMLVLLFVEQLSPVPPFIPAYPDRGISQFVKGGS